MTASVLVFNHTLSRFEARRRVQKLLKAVGDKSTRWAQTWRNDHHLVFATDWQGSRIHGEVVVKAAVIELTLNLPWALHVFGGPLRQAIQKAVLQALERN